MVPTNYYLIFSDEPLVSAQEVDYYPTTDDLSLIEQWTKYTISKALVDNLPTLKRCKEFLRIPAVKYPKKMAEKSNSWFLTLKMEDPASNSGIISLYKVNIGLRHSSGQDPS